MTFWSLFLSEDHQLLFYYILNLLKVRKKQRWLVRVGIGLVLTISCKLLKVNKVDLEFWVDEMVYLENMEPPAKIYGMPV